MVWIQRHLGTSSVSTLLSATSGNVERIDSAICYIWERRSIDSATSGSVDRIDSTTSGNVEHIDPRFWHQNLVQWMQGLRYLDQYVDGSSQWMSFLNYWSCCNRKLITVTKVSIEDYWKGLRLEKSKNEERCREEKDLSLFVEKWYCFCALFSIFVIKKPYELLW